MSLSSKYEINYTTIKNEGEKRAKAIADIIGYLGDKEWQRIKGVLLKELPTRPSLQTVAQCLWFVGIEGYPCEAVLETLWPAKPKLTVVK